jgi:hypothetical protein
MGLDPAAAAAWAPPPPADDPAAVLLEEVVAPVALFLALRTQWRRAGLDGRMVGLDYAAARSVAEWQGMTVDAALLNDLMVLEAAALAELHRPEAG